MKESKKTKLIAIAGGIGSGKSVVSSVLRSMGYVVYDCDAEAKRLMNTLQEIKDELVKSFGNQSVTDEGLINTSHISSVVFQDKKALSTINSIVHPRVKEDIISCLNGINHDVFFIETAILMQSNLLDIIDEVWLVTAPDEIRIKRVMNRNRVTAEDVKKRINAQCGQDYSTISNLKEIINDNVSPILPQLIKLLQEKYIK